MPSKVMVVEDEQILARNLLDYLQIQGMQVQLAHGGANAIELARQFRPDAVVLDFRLPDMEGFQVHDAIREFSDCPFLLITGHPTSEVRYGAELRSISCILFKPFPLAELAEVLRQLLATQQVAGNFAERRRNQAVSFPMRMYDGTWVVTDRRRRSTPTGDDEEPSAQSDPSTGS